MNKVNKERKGLETEETTYPSGHRFYVKLGNGITVTDRQ